MPKLLVITLDGEQRELDVAAGDTAMAAIIAAGINDIEAICGGSCACATCHVYVDAAFFDRLAPISEDEQVLIEGTEHYRRGASRLSCQIRMSDELDALALTIAPEG